MKALHKSKGGNGFLLVSGNINTKHSGKKIDEIEIVPNHHGRWFDIRYKYKVIDKVKIEPINKTTQISNNIPNDISLENFAAIDLGVVNLATIYSPNKNIRPFIINGREITHVNYTTKRALASLSRKYRKYTDKHYTVLEKRQHRIHNCMHTASSAVIKYCQLNNIKQLVTKYQLYREAHATGPYGDFHRAGGNDLLFMTPDGPAPMSTLLPWAFGPDDLEK